MNRIKYFVAVILLFVFAASASGCSTIGFYIDKKKHASNVMDQVVEFLDNGDPKALCGMFSGAAQDNDCLYGQLDSLCYIWENLEPEVTHKKYTTGGGAYDNGEYSRLELRYTIEVKADNGMVFEISVTEDWINDDDKDQKGLHSLGFYTEDCCIYAVAADGEYVDNDEDLDEERIELIGDLLDLMEDDDFIDADPEERSEMAIDLLNDFAEDEYNNEPTFTFYDGTEFCVPINDIPD